MFRTSRYDMVEQKRIPQNATEDASGGGGGVGIYSSNRGGVGGWVGFGRRDTYTVGLHFYPRSVEK